MRILFHVGVGNLDRPYRWQFINMLFSNLARTLEKLGHECLLWNHSEAKNPLIYKNNFNSILVNGVQLSEAKKFNPEWVFTWNGGSEGDREIIKEFGEEKMVFAELGFFDHYKTLFFDFKGVNGNSENLTCDLSPFNEECFNEIKKTYIKPPLYNGRFIFIPLQDEKDTNITQNSPFKRWMSFYNMFKII